MPRLPINPSLFLSRASLSSARQPSISHQPMRSFRTSIQRNLPQLGKALTSTTTPLSQTAIRNMSLFAPRLYTNQPSFSGLFRLLDDFDKYTSEVGNTALLGGEHTRLPNFTPRFDLRETETAYELSGELPGINKDNVSIEFPDPQTLVVSGKVERSYEAGTPPAGAIEGGKQPAAIESGKETGNEGETQQASGQQQEEQQQSKYWVSERSVGQFSRAFNFPAPVDTETVSASLKDGILNLTVPKSKRHESRRITIN